MLVSHCIKLLSSGCFIDFLNNFIVNIYVLSSKESKFFIKYHQKIHRDIFIIHFECKKSQYVASILKLFHLEVVIIFGNFLKYITKLEKLEK